MAEIAHPAPEAGRKERPAVAEVKVWDVFVRIFHWSLVTAFAVAFLSAGHSDKVHEAAGYTVLVLVGLRFIWGLVGSRHARFSDFVYRPSTVARFLADTARLRARRYVGHNPAGGAMVIALLLAVTTTCVSGIMMTSEAFWGQKWIEKVHEAAAYGTLGLVALHVFGVIVASLEHRENLAKAMWTGRKRV